MDILFSIGSFIVALAILIAVHEFGHFWVARRVGVKVLKFSIGFGRPLLRWQPHPDDTEYVVALIPLGGYVKMLDEREEAVPEGLLDRAFNRQALWKRSAIVVAGPLFNLLFAILAYWAIFIAGDTGLKPVVGVVEPRSIAAESGFREGDELLMIGERPARSWETAVMAFTIEAMGDADLRVRVRDAAGQVRERVIASDAITASAEEPDLLGRLGLEPRRPADSRGHRRNRPGRGGRARGACGGRQGDSRGWTADRGLERLGRVRSRAPGADHRRRYRTPGSGCPAP